MSQKIIQDIPLNRIISGKQVRERFDDESLVGLTQSFRESGQQEPIHVVPMGGDMYSLLTGGRRLRAARKAGWTSVAAIVEDGELTKGEILVRQIIENEQREALNPLEKGKAIDLLMKETGWNATQVAAKLGMTNGAVSKLLALLSLPGAIQEKLRSGELPATAGYELTRESDAAKQDQLASQVASGAMTRDGLTAAINGRKRNHRNKRSASRRCTRVTVKLEDRQSVTVSSPALDLNAFLHILKTLLGHAEQASSEGLTLDALLKRLKAGPRKSTPATEPAPAAVVDTPSCETVSDPTGDQHVQKIGHGIIGTDDGAASDFANVRL